MASEQQLKVVITAIDQASAKIEAINARVKAMSAPVREVGARLGHLAEESGLRTIGERARIVGERFEHLKRSIEGIAGPLLGLGALASVAGLAEAARKTAEYSEQLYLASKATGLTTQQLGGLNYAAGIAGVTWSQLNRGVQYFNRNIAEAAAGKLPMVQALFAQMGVRSTPGHLLNTAEGLKKVAAEAKYLVGSGQTQLASLMMSTLFGQRSGMQLLPFFAQGPAHIQELMKKAQSFGLAPSDAQTKAGYEFNERFKEMAGAVQGFENTVAYGLYPVLTPIIVKMTDWIAANREWIATGIGAGVQDLADYLKSINWSRVGSQFRALGEDAKWLFQHLGGVKGVMVLIAGIELGPVILATTTLGVAAARAMALIGAAIIANPVVAAIILGGAAIGIGAYELIKHWTEVEAFFKRFGAAVEQVFDDLMKKIQPIVDAMHDAANWLTGIVPDQAPDPKNIRARNLWQQHHPGQSLGQHPAAAVGASDGSRRMQAWLTAHHYTAAAAAAIMGNASVESSFNPAATQGGGAHRGLFQWDRSRYQGGDFDAQMAHMDDELSGLDPGFKSRSGDPGELARRFERVFERSGGQLNDQRMARAEGFAKQGNARVEIHVSSDSNLVTGLRRPVVSDNLDVNTNLGEAMAY